MACNTSSLVCIVCRGRFGESCIYFGRVISFCQKYLLLLWSWNTFASGKQRCLHEVYYDKLSGQLPQWPESTSSGSLDVLSPGEHENSCCFLKLFHFYCRSTAQSRQGSSIPWQEVQRGDAGTPRTQLPAPRASSWLPPATRSSPLAGRELLAQPPRLGARCWGRVAPGDSSSFQTCLQARAGRCAPSPLLRPPKPGILLVNPGGCHAQGGEVGLLLGGRDAVQNMPLKGRGSILLKRE